MLRKTAMAFAFFTLPASGMTLMPKAYVNCITCNTSSGKCTEDGMRYHKFRVPLQKNHEGQDVGFGQLNFRCNGESFLGKLVLSVDKNNQFSGNLSVSSQAESGIKAKTFIKSEQLDAIKKLSVVIGQLPMKQHQNMDIVFGIENIHKKSTH